MKDIAGIVKLKKDEPVCKKCGKDLLVVGIKRVPQGYLTLLWCESPCDTSYSKVFQDVIPKEDGSGTVFISVTSVFSTKKVYDIGM